MIWNTKLKQNAQPLIAEEDLKTIAFLVEDETLLYSPYMEHPYHTDDKSKKIDVVCDRFHDIFIVEHGYLSYQYGNVTHKNQTYTVHNGDDEYGWVFDVASENIPVKPYECIIPKGTKYYIDENHKIVSETIIVKEPFVCR